VSQLSLLLIVFYFPPGGGVGVERPLKLATYLADLGIGVHVLAPRDPRWVHRDEGRLIPPTVVVHRAPYLGPSGRIPAQELFGTSGLVRMWRKSRLFGRRLLVPDEHVGWVVTATPAALRVVREHSIDAVITTSPPNSNHLVGGVVQLVAGVPWLADLRDPVVAHPHRRVERRLVRLKEEAQWLVLRAIERADGVSCVSAAIADEVQARRPRGVVNVIANGADFADFDGLDYRRGERFRITHAGSFFGRRDPRSFLAAVAQVEGVTARFVGDFRPSDRQWLAQQKIDERVELIPYTPHRRSLELQRDSDALLLLIPDADGRGRGILSGKVYEYLAAGRPILAAVPPDGAAAKLIRDLGAGVVVAPDDVEGMVRALSELRDQWRAGTLASFHLPVERRDEIDWRSRALAFHGLLTELTASRRNGSPTQSDGPPTQRRLGLRLPRSQIETRRRQVEWNKRHTGREGG
jgi:glycosyltransferase involved in cell wall biosynthesis